MRLVVLTLLMISPVGLLGQINRPPIADEMIFGDTSQVHLVILVNYSRLLGAAEKIDGENVLFRLRSAKETSKIPLEDIRYLGIQDILTPGDFKQSPPLQDLTYERTAFPFSSKGQLKAFMFIYLGAEMNVNEHFQLGLGTAGPLGLLATARVRTSLSPNVHVALSNQTLFLPLLYGLESYVPIVGDVTTILTLGTPRRFLNLGYGLIYFNDEDADNTWLARMGAGGRIQPHWDLYVEAVASFNSTIGQLEIYPGFTAAYGARRHRWQFGLMAIVPDQSSTEATNLPTAIPFVGYVVYW